jgi:hypothetical protein
MKFLVEPLHKELPPPLTLLLNDAKTYTTSMQSQSQPNNTTTTTTTKQITKIYTTVQAHYTSYQKSH